MPGRVDDFKVAISEWKLTPLPRMVERDIEIPTELRHTSERVENK